MTEQSVLLCSFNIIKLAELTPFLMSWKQAHQLCWWYCGKNVKEIVKHCKSTRSGRGKKVKNSPTNSDFRQSRARARAGVFLQPMVDTTVEKRFSLLQYPLSITVKKAFPFSLWRGLHTSKYPHCGPWKVPFLRRCIFPEGTMPYGKEPTKKYVLLIETVH